jgi:hypothetical protein
MKKLLAICCLVTLLAGVDLAKADTIYDAASGFSNSNNPTGVWSYGYSQTLGGTFTVYTGQAIDSGIDFWGRGSMTAWTTVPWVAHNSTDLLVDWNTASGHVHFQPGQLGFHPGLDSVNQFSIIRFTSPTAGLFDLSSSFSGLDMTEGTTTGVQVRLNGSSLFTGQVNGSVGTSYTKTLMLAVGDTVDFTVDWGVNGTAYFDSTGVSATLTAVPTPSSFAALIGMGLVGLVGVARRRWKK